MDIRLMVYTIAILLSVNVCLMLVFILGMSEWPNATTQDRICLPNEAGCLKCGIKADVFNEYIERIATKTYDEIETHEQEQRVRETCKEEDNQWGNKKPAAKLTGKKQSSALNKGGIGTDMTLVTDWRHGNELRKTGGFQRNGIVYRNGRLIVPIDGTYFVHSFVELLEPCNPPTETPNIKECSKLIKHSIFRFNIQDKKDTEIVSNVQPRTVSVSQSKYLDSYNSYVSSLVELKAGDEISVKLSNITFLKSTEDNYFGVSLI